VLNLVHACSIRETKTKRGIKVQDTLSQKKNESLKLLIYFGFFTSFPTIATEAISRRFPSLFIYLVVYCLFLLFIFVLIFLFLLFIFVLIFLFLLSSFSLSVTHFLILFLHFQHILLIFQQLQNVISSRHFHTT
jgi:hypothetical protein